MLGDDLASRPTRHSRSRVLRLRGLPYRAVEEDIRQFFTPIAVTRVYLCRRNGAPSSYKLVSSQAAQTVQVQVIISVQVEQQERRTPSLKTRLKPARR